MTQTAGTPLIPPGPSPIEVEFKPKFCRYCGGGGIQEVRTSICTIVAGACGYCDGTGRVK